MVTINQLNQFLEKWEQYLGYGACIPGVNRFSVRGRYLLGVTEIVGGLGVGIFNYINSLTTEDEDEKLEYAARVNKSIEYIDHGLLNIARSYFERFSILISLSLVFAYDLKNRKIFNYNNLFQGKHQEIPLTRFVT